MGDEEGGHETRPEEEEPVVPVTVAMIPQMHMDASYDLNELDESQNRNHVNQHNDNPHVVHQHNDIAFPEMNGYETGITPQPQMAVAIDPMEQELEFKADALALPEEPRHEESYHSMGPNEEPMLQSGNGTNGYGNNKEDVMLQQEPVLQSGMGMTSMGNGNGNGMGMNVNDTFSQLEVQPEIRYRDDDDGVFDGDTAGGDVAMEGDGMDIVYEDNPFGDPNDSEQSEEDNHNEMYASGSGRATLGGPRESYKE